MRLVAYRYGILAVKLIHGREVLILTALHLESEEVQRDRELADLARRREMQRKLAALCHGNIDTTHSQIIYVGT